MAILMQPNVQAPRNFWKPSMTKLICLGLSLGISMRSPTSMKKVDGLKGAPTRWMLFALTTVGLRIWGFLGSILLGAMEE